MAPKRKPRFSTLDEHTLSPMAASPVQAPLSKTSGHIFNVAADQLKLIPYFSGCPSEDYRESLRDFEDVATMFNWSDTEKLMALKQKLTAAAKTFVRQLAHAPESYTDLTNTLSAHYEKRKDATTQLQEFLAFSQPPHMSVSEYFSQLTNLSFKTFRRGELAEDIEEANRIQMLKAQILKNLLPEIKRGVLARNLKTLEEIKQQALLEERAWKACNPEADNQTCEKPHVFAVTQPAIEQNPDRVTMLENQVATLTDRIDRLLRKNESEQNLGPWCRFCRKPFRPLP